MAWTAIPYVTLSITVFVCEQRPAQKLYSMAWTAIPYVTLSITVFVCEQRPAQKLYSMAWTAIPYVTLSITVFVCEQRPAQKLSSMAWTAIPYVTLSITVFFMFEHVRPKLSKNKPLNLLLKWKHWAVSNRSIFFLTLKNGRKKNSEKKQCTIKHQVRNKQPLQSVFSGIFYS